MFDFSSFLSTVATKAAGKFAGFPPYHFVGGNID